jgi:hypothetical protein
VIRVIAVLVVAAASGFAEDKEARFFDEKVAPILTRSCLGCHNHELDDGGISFENRATLIRPRGEHPAAIIPGKPAESLLVQAIRHDGDVQMPPGKKLPAENIATLMEWIRRGAPWGSKLTAESK